MKTFTISILMMVTTIIFAQDYERFRCPEKMRIQLEKKGDSSIKNIETALDENERMLRLQNLTAILNEPAEYLDALRENALRNPKLYAKICITCYESELRDQSKRFEENQARIIEHHIQPIKMKGDGRYKYYYRINDQSMKNIREINPALYQMIYTLQKGMDTNEMSYNLNHPEYSFEPYQLIEKARKEVDEMKNKDAREMLLGICFDCYNEDYQDQLKRLNIKKNYVESVKSKNLESEVEDKKLAYNPYYKYIVSIDIMANELGIAPDCFTLFTGMDFSMAHTRLTNFLKLKMGLEQDERYLKETGSTYSTRFVPHNYSKYEYLDISYTYVLRNDLPSYEGTLQGKKIPSRVIKRVDISGSPNLLYDLYVSYWWKLNFELGDPKAESVANHVFMGDYISLSNLSQTVAKITILRQNYPDDYFETYDILERYKRWNVEFEK